MSQKQAPVVKKKTRAAKRRAKMRAKKQPAAIQPVQKVRELHPVQKKFLKEKASKIPGAGVPKVEEESGQNMNIPVSTIPVLANFALAVQGGMQQAVANGFEAWAENQNMPGAAYYAYVYLTQILFAYTSNAPPQAVTVPLWLDVLGTALLPHIVPFGQGKIAYSFVTDTNYPGTLPSKTQALTGFYWMYQGNPGGDVVNGFITMAAPVAYTSELGIASYQLLQRYVSNNIEWPGWVPVLPGNSWTKKDSSAYAASWVQLGAGSSIISGVLNEVMLETPLTAPIFAKFADWYASTPRRYFRQTRSSGGDANYLGFLLSIETIRRRVKSKIIPKFKQIDFNEYMDVLGWWLAGALFNTANNVIIYNNNPPVCPLTWQQLAICVRQAIGNCWMPHNLSGQFIESEGQTVNVNFQPFTWGTNCYPSTLAGSLKLPRIFVESVRCMQGYMVDVNFYDAATKKDVVGGMAYAAPVLGTYQSDEPVTQYYYTTSAGEFPVFTVEPGEVAIDLVDFTYFSGTSMPLDVNGTQLNVLIETWNSWITTTIDSNITGLEAIGSDCPPKQLHSLHLTNFLAPIVSEPSVSSTRKVIGCAAVKKSPLGREKKFKRTVSVEKGKETDLRVEISASQDNWGAVSVISQNTILKVVYENWQNIIVLPSVRTVQFGSDFLTPYDFSSLGAAYNEPYSLTLSQAADDTLSPYESLTSRHKKFASTMYRTSTAPENTLEVFLKECVKTGRGGSLGSMFGSLAGGLLERYIPGATQIGGALGNVIGDLIPV